MGIRTIAFAGALAAAAAITPAPAMAATFETPAAAACKSALPVYDGNIRSRPRAVQNEGTSNAFVTCAQQVGDDAAIEFTMIRLNNPQPVEVLVHCTLVIGNPQAPEFISAGYLLPAQLEASISYRVQEITTWSLPLLAYSCELPPGIGITRLSYSTF